MVSANVLSGKLSWSSTNTFHLSMWQLCWFPTSHLPKWTELWYQMPTCILQNISRRAALLQTVPLHRVRMNTVVQCSCTCSLGRCSSPCHFFKYLTGYFGFWEGRGNCLLLGFVVFFLFFFFLFSKRNKCSELIWAVCFMWHQDKL